MTNLASIQFRGYDTSFSLYPDNTKFVSNQTFPNQPVLLYISRTWDWIKHKDIANTESSV